MNESTTLFAAYIQTKAELFTLLKMKT